MKIIEKIIVAVILMLSVNVMAGPIVFSDLTEAQALDLISDNPHIGTGVVRAGGNGADEMRLSDMSYTDIVSDMDIGTDWVANNVNYGFQIAYDASLSTL